jgi:hypothetical protein
MGLDLCIHLEQIDLELRFGLHHGQARVSTCLPPILECTTILNARHLIMEKSSHYFFIGVGSL